MAYRSKQINTSSGHSLSDNLSSERLRRNSDHTEFGVEKGKPEVRETDWSSSFSCCLGRGGLCESHGFQNFIEFLKYLIYGTEVFPYHEDQVDTNSRLTTPVSTYREYEPHFPVEEAHNAEVHKNKNKNYRTQVRRALSSGSVSEIDGNKEVIIEGLKSSVFAISPPLYHIRVEEAFKSREAEKLHRKGAYSQYSTAASFGETTTPRTVITTNDPVDDGTRKDGQINMVASFDISSPRSETPVQDPNMIMPSPSTDFQIMTPLTNIKIPRLSMEKIKSSMDILPNGKSKDSQIRRTPRDKLRKTIRNVQIKNLLLMPKRAQAVEQFFPEPDFTVETCELPSRFHRSIGSSTSRSVSSSFTVRSNQSIKKNSGQTRNNSNRKSPR